MGDDFIQDAVNKEIELGIQRKIKSIQYKRELFNKKNNEIRRKRKQARKNRRRGRC